MQNIRSDPAVDDDRVMTFLEWCRLNGISKATGLRLKARGEGPRFINLSERRIGVTRRENRRWQESRAREQQA
jgi:hypothetical protein